MCAVRTRRHVVAMLLQSAQILAGGLAHPPTTVAGNSSPILPINFFDEITEKTSLIKF
jgi:hypothetical protein